MVLDRAVVDLRDDVPHALRARAVGGAAPPRLPVRAAGETELILRARSPATTAPSSELLGTTATWPAARPRSYFLLGADRDDVVQEGMIGLYKAIRDFDVDLGVPFRSFAEVCVTRQILTAVKSASRHKHGVLSRSLSLDQPVEGSPDLSLADLLPAAIGSDPAASVISADEVRALQQHFSEVLSDLERQVLRHHVEGKSYDEIAAMLQRHVKSVDNALQRIKRKLETHLAERRAEPAHED
jgi:RNA polymerase sporulation-specific sigma factor